MRIISMAFPQRQHKLHTKSNHEPDPNLNLTLTLYHYFAISFYCWRVCFTRVQFYLSVLIIWSATQYLAVHCVPLSSQTHLRSTERNLLHLPRHRLNMYRRRAFAIAGPSAWNTLPDPVRNQKDTETAFRRQLKTFLFARFERISHLPVMRDTNLHFDFFDQT